MSYFHGKYIPLSSALRRFTVLFGMERGGATSLWSSGKERRPTCGIQLMPTSRSNSEEAKFKKSKRVATHKLFNTEQ